MNIGNLPAKADLMLEDLFTLVYCLVEDRYRLLFEAPSSLRQSPNNQPDFTDAEIITERPPTIGPLRVRVSRSFPLR